MNPLTNRQQPSFFAGLMAALAAFAGAATPWRGGNAGTKSRARKARAKKQDAKAQLREAIYRNTYRRKHLSRNVLRRHKRIAKAQLRVDRGY